MNQELIDAVLDQIKCDIICRDYTAIEELLKAIPEHLLVGFLTEGDAE
jgi:hypothetical protein